MNKKILISLSIIGAVAAIAVGGTIAYFSDTETSTGNTFTAGTLDLKIGSQCKYNGQAQDFCTWVSKDLDGDVFFNFSDVKPGDSGENTISFDIENNPAWACAYVTGIVDSDNTCVGPEIATHGQTGGDPECASSTDIGDGELDENLYVTVWVDEDCDNELDGEEEVIIDDEPVSQYIDGQSSVVIPVADSSNDSLMDEPLQPGSYCIGIAWNVSTDTGNAIQSDKLGADLIFYIEQARNNEKNFQCQQRLPQVMQRISLD